MATHVHKRSVTDVLADEREPAPAPHTEPRSVSDVLADERERTPEKPALTEEIPGAHAGFFTKAKLFLKRLFSDALDDNIDSVGAMMAYYAVLAIFPMLVFIVTIAMLVLDDSTVQQGVSMATSTMPYATRQLVATKVQAFMDTAGAGFAIGGAAFALWGASRGTVALSMALNSVFSKKETRPWWKRQLIAIAVTVGVAFLIVAALGLLVIGPIAGHFVADRIGMGATFDVVWGVGRWLGAGVLVMVVWAILYKFLPNTDAPFRIFTPGAAVGVILWLGISLLFGVYLKYFNNYEATYGALGAGIIFLTWLWLSNIAILFGAEINDVLADFRKHESEAAAQLATETKPPATK
ncbi:MAG: YihY/virulence factor BrkB family protein [Deltaproteobacteria bacterium]|nr:YihY/virulence factor BrkB family protein [Deltaproteobacteria bacterium]